LAFIWPFFILDSRGFVLFEIAYCQIWPFLDLTTLDYPASRSNSLSTFTEYLPREKFDGKKFAEKVEFLENRFEL
jgi:hypothetical protein